MLQGSIEDFDRKIAIFKIMEMVKQCQENGYVYRVFYAEDGHPGGIVYMTPHQIRELFGYCDVSSLDWQLKRKIMYGWVFCGPVGTNNYKKLVSFHQYFMIVEILGFVEFLIKSMSKISGQALSDINLIEVDGKFDQDSFCDALSVMFCMMAPFIFTTKFHSHVVLSQFSKN